MARAIIQTSEIASRDVKLTLSSDAPEHIWEGLKRKPSLSKIRLCFYATFYRIIVREKNKMPTRFKLNTGDYIPAVGFGTWQDEHAQEKAVEEAINAGYHHIDTAQAWVEPTAERWKRREKTGAILTKTQRYGTEKFVGNGIRKSGIAREQLFVTTKVWNNYHHPDGVPKSLQNSLDDLGLDYVDAFLIHWPVAWKRGSDPFPKDANGNLIMEDIDWLDVRAPFAPILDLYLTRD